MHIHILGICGTFMGGVAVLSQASGYKVTGCDLNIYPPMSTQLKKLGIEVFKGFDKSQLNSNPDHIIVGNVMSRGQSIIETMLDDKYSYSSGPEWISNKLLKDCHVIAVAGTHGKTTTASMIAWILEDVGLEPGFLIGGVPKNFGISARMGSSKFFIIEADEYDTAFFDKRAKFVHYKPQTLVLNNLEYDHADIYKNLEEIKWQFHQLLRMVPAGGKILVNGADKNLKSLINMGCWTPVQNFGIQNSNDWSATFKDNLEKHIQVKHPDGKLVDCQWKIGGAHNLENAVAAIAAAGSVGVNFENAVEALSRFEGVKRRMELTATIGDINIYDDFAHHPTAIRSSIASMRQRNPGRRVLVAVEPRSNTMKLGIHNKNLANSLREGDFIWMYKPKDIDKNFDSSLESLGNRAQIHNDHDELVFEMSKKIKSGDQIIFMSNGSFGSVRQKLTNILKKAYKV